MNYIDIVNQFTEIKTVYVGRNYSEKKFYVRVQGTNAKGYHDSYTQYEHIEVAKAVAKLISYFKGVK